MKKLVLVILGLLALMVCSCRGTRIITVDTPKIEKEYVVSVDTVHQFDSIYVFNDRYIIGDTVVVSKYVDRYNYLYKTRTDTLLRIDTVTVVNTKQIEALSDENDKLKATMNFYRHLGLSLLVIIGMMGLYILVKR